MSVVAFGAAATNGAGAAASGSAVGNRPTGTAQNQLLLAGIATGSTTVTVSAVPSGWTLLQGPTGTNARSFLYGKIAGASEPTTWSWTLSASVFWTVNVSAYSGNSLTLADHLSSAVAGTASTLASTPVTTTVAGCLVAYMGTTVTNASNAATTFTTVPTGVNSPFDAQSGTTGTLSANTDVVTARDTANQTAAGATTARTFTISGTPSQAVVYTIAVAPFGATPGVTVLRQALVTASIR